MTFAPLGLFRIRVTRKKFFHAVSVITPLGLGGCWTTTASTPVPLAEALAIVERDVRNTNPVALSDLDQNGDAQILSLLHSFQCASKNANPLVPVIAGPIDIQLQGSIQQAGALAGGFQAGPLGTLTYTVTQGEQQQISVPIMFVSVRGIPNFYLGQNLTNLANEPDADKSDDVKKFKARRASLAAIADKAIEEFNTSTVDCSKFPASNGVIAPQLQ